MKIHYNNGENEKIISGIVSIIPGSDDPSMVECVSKTGKSYKIHMVNIKFIYDDSLPNPSVADNNGQTR